MKNGKYAKHRGVASKTLALVVVMMLVIGCTIGGTIAWLTDETDSVLAAQIQHESVALQSSARDGQRRKHA